MCFVCIQARANPDTYSGHIRSDTLQTPSSGTAANTTGNAAALLDGISWGGSYGTAATVKYTFSLTGLDSGITYTNNASAFNNAEQQAVLGVFAKLSAIANITFELASSPSAAQMFFYKGVLTLANTAGVAGYYYSGSQLTEVAVGMDTNYSSDFATQGTYDYTTLLHEIGHAVGLKHPHDGSPNLPSNLDSTNYTVMSYNSVSNPSNFQSIDIEALQILYGAASGSTTVGSDGEVILGDSDDNYTAGATAENIKGGLGTDTLVGGAGNDTIYGGRSQADPDDPGDTIRGEGGNDEIYGNGGDDSIQGNQGNDTVWGGRGFDTIYGGDGDDSLAGGGGIAHPEDESDTIYGGAGNDSIIGNGGDDLIYGEAGNDTFWGGYGNDTFYGGDGNDLIIGQFGDDYLVGGAGNDVFFFYNENNNDTIADFAFGDIIRLDRNINNSGINTAADAAAYSSFSDGVATIDFGGGHMISIITSAALTAASFEIV